MNEKYVLLKPEDFTPINIKEVEKEWKRTNNVPTGSDWSEIERSLNMINEEFLPYTLKTYVLNNLSYCVVHILMNQSNIKK